MDDNFDFIRRKVVLFKLSVCCWIAPIRIGLLAIGYLNFVLSIIFLIGSSNDTFSPTIQKVQVLVLEDNASSTVCLLAYAIEEASNVVLLVGVYRNDRVLLRAYLLYEIAVTVAGVLIYSIVIFATDVIMKITIFAGTLFQIYIILLVRSAIVEIREKEYDITTNGGITLKDVISIPKEQPLPIDKQPTKEKIDETSPSVETKIELESIKVEETQIPLTNPIEQVKEPEECKVDTEKEKLKTIPEENVQIPKRKLNLFKKTTSYKKNNGLKSEDESSKIKDVTTKNIDTNLNKTGAVSDKTDESPPVIKNGETSTKC